MGRIRKVKLKPKFIIFLKVIGVIFCVFFGLLLFYFKQVNDLGKIGYSRKASNNILFSFHKDDVLSIGENKTLNEAFESDEFKEKYMDNYSKIDYVDQEHLIANINKLLKVGYSNNDINIILSHGNDYSVTEFAKREKVRYLEEFFSIDYAKLDYYDRYVAYSDDTGEDEDATVLFVNLDLDKEDYQDSVLVSEFSTSMLINKHRYLNDKFVPKNLVKIDRKYASDDGLECAKVALDAYKKMSEAAEKEGYNIVINSAYRSYQDQVDLSELYLKSYGQSYVDKFVAKPGYSEHQTGLAFDIGSKNTNVFANSKEYQWMMDNAYKYGFIRRFTKQTENVTGFRNEPWHYRYVGEKIAKYIQENNMAFEEYWVMFLDK